MPCKKPTDLWVSKSLPRTIEFLGTEDDPKWLCTPESPCWKGGDGHHEPVRGNSKKFTPYPEQFVKAIMQVVDQDLAHLRKKAAAVGALSPLIPPSQPTAYSPSRRSEETDTPTALCFPVRQSALVRRCAP